MALPTDAVCCEPPARIVPGMVESPYSTVTLSGARPRRSAATSTCVVAVPMPISCAAVSMRARPSRVSVMRAAPPGMRWYG